MGKTSKKALAKMVADKIAELSVEKLKMEYESPAFRTHLADLFRSTADALDDNSPHTSTTEKDFRIAKAFTEIEAYYVHVDTIDEIKHEIKQLNE